MVTEFFQAGNFGLQTRDDSFTFAANFFFPCEEAVAFFLDHINGVVYFAQKNRTKSGLLPSKDMLKIFKGCRKILTKLYLSRLLIRPAIL